MYWCIAIFLIASLSALAQNSGVEFLAPCNSLYWDGPNQIKISRNGKLLNPNDYKVEVEGGTFMKNDSCIWIDPCCGVRHSVTLLEKSDSMIGKQIFRIIPWPTFEYHGWGWYHSIDKSWLSGIISIVPLTNDPHEFNVRVLSYDIHITIGNESRIFECSGPEIPDTVRALFLAIKAFSHIEVSNLTLEGKKGEHYNGSSLGELPNKEVNGYNKYLRDYYKLFFDFKKFDYSSISDTLERYFGLYLNNSDRLLESNCSFSSDSCTTSLYFVMNGSKQLAVRYRYLGDDSEKVELYYINGKIAEINYYKDSSVQMFNATSGTI